MEEVCTYINLRSGLYGTGLWTQNSSYPVYGRYLDLNKSHIWVIWHRSVTLISSYPLYGRGLYLNKSQIGDVWHRSVNSKFVISSIWKRYVLKKISDLGYVAQVCGLKIRHNQYMEDACTLINLTSG